MEQQVLEMIFRTGMGRTYRITLDDPRANIDSTEVQAVMELILSKDIFNVEGGLTGIEGANIITTQENPVVFA
jgi:hypothetical protein